MQESFTASIVKSLMSNSVSQRGGNSMGSSTKLTFWHLLLIAIISLFITSAVVHWSYNEVMPKVMASQSDKRFVPLTWWESTVLVILVRSLIWL